MRCLILRFSIRIRNRKIFNNVSQPT